MTFPSVTLSSTATYVKPKLQRLAIKAWLLITILNISGLTFFSQFMKYCIRQYVRVQALSFVPFLTHRNKLRITSQRRWAAAQA